MFQVNHDQDLPYTTNKFQDAIRRLNKQQGVHEKKEILVTGESGSMTKSGAIDAESSVNNEHVIINRSIATMHKKELLKNIG